MLDWAAFGHSLREKRNFEIGRSVVDNVGVEKTTDKRADSTRLA